MIIELPTQAELTLTIVYGDQKKDVDILELDEVFTEACRESNKMGDTNAYLDYFKQKLLEKYSLDLPKRMVELLAAKYTMQLDELKKKFSLLQELFASTESPSEQTSPTSNTSS